MWKKIKDSQYFLLLTINHGYEICVTDYLNIWIATFSEKALLAQLKQSNDGLELENDNDFIQKGLFLLTSLDKLKKLSIKTEENGKNLFITMTISLGFPFYFECKLMKGSEELYFQKITQPCLKIIGDLRASQTELRRLLMKKDSEIEEYKCEGGEIVLRHLKTVIFNDEEHMKKHKVYEEHFGASEISTSLIEKLVEVPEQIVIKQEPHTPQTTECQLNIKMETTSNLKTEPVTEIKTEFVPNFIMEQNTECAEESNVSVISAPVSCKQEIKKEIRTHVPRKRSKFNF